MADLFRKNALDTLSSPEQLDKHIEIISPPIWILCFVLVIGMITFVLWSFTYPITSGTHFKGVIFPNNNVVQKKALRDCIVTDVLVLEGEHVNIGDIIAVVSYYEMLDDIANARLELSELDTSEYPFDQDYIQELVDQYVAMTVIKSSTSGYIQNVVSDGASLKTGDFVFSVMPDSSYNEVVSYVSMQTAKSLSLGMPAQISPVYAAREEYGYMTGTITEIGNTPVSEESIIAKMGTLSYVKDILPDSSCVEVRIRLDLDNEAENNYHWSNEKGEKLYVGFGTQCSVTAVTNEYHPIELLLN